jgi:outer membrane protein
LQTVIVDVETAYFDLLAKRAQQDAQTEVTLALKAGFEAAEARARGGLAARADTLRAQAALAEAALALQTAERDVIKADAALKRAAGVNQTQTLELAWDNTPPPPDVAPAVLDALLADAHRLRPDLAAITAQAAAARDDARRADAARWPVLNLTANGGRTYFLEDDRVASTTYSVGMNVAIPLFDGGRLRAEARAARRDADALVAERDDLQESVDLDIANARADLVHAQAQREGIATQFAAASESARAAAARYRAGLGSLLELLTAEGDLARARQAQAQASADWLAAFSRLNHALGLGLVDVAYAHPAHPVAVSLSSPGVAPASEHPASSTPGQRLPDTKAVTP